MTIRIPLRMMLRNWKMGLPAVDPSSRSIIQNSRTPHLGLPVNNRLWTWIMNGSFSHKPRAASSIFEYEEGFADDGQQDDEPLGEKSPESHQFSRFYQLSTELYVGQQDDEPLEVDSRDPRQLFPGHQFQYTSYHPLSAMAITCPKPIRNYPTHKVILEPGLFEDWHVDMSEPIIDHEEFSSDLLVDWLLNLSEPICVDEALGPEHSSISSKTPAVPPELGTSFPARQDTPHPEVGDDEEEDADLGGDISRLLTNDGMTPNRFWNRMMRP